VLLCAAASFILAGQNEKGFVALLAQHLTLLTVGDLLVEGFWKRRGFS